MLVSAADGTLDGEEYTAGRAHVCRFEKREERRVPPRARPARTRESAKTWRRARIGVPGVLGSSNTRVPRCLSLANGPTRETTQIDHDGSRKLLIPDSVGNFQWQLR